MLNECGALFEIDGDVDARAELEAAGEEQKEEKPEENHTQFNNPDQSDLDPPVHEAESETADVEETLVGTSPAGLPAHITNGGRTVVQIGGVLPVLFRQVVRVGGSWTVPRNVCIDERKSKIFWDFKEQWPEILNIFGKLMAQWPELLEILREFTDWWENFS